MAMRPRFAGWRFAQDELDNPKRRAWLADVHAAAKVDVFASTHTCLAALRDFALPGGRLTVINNGAAGMPNFRGTRFGVITRIATSPSPHRPLYGAERDGIHIDALAVDYDQQRISRPLPGALAAGFAGACVVPRAYRRWSRLFAGAGGAMKLSIIMPVLNEAAESRSGA